MAVKRKKKTQMIIGADRTEDEGRTASMKEKGTVGQIKAKDRAKRRD